MLIGGYNLIIIILIHEGNDKSDAFRHSYYNVINVKVVGIARAKEFSDANESEVPTSLIKEKEMDLFNNNVGHQTINGNGGKSFSGIIKYNL